MKHATNEGLLTTIEAARMTGMAVRSIQLMADRGELEVWKTPGGHRRILRDSIDQWLVQSGHASITRPMPLAPMSEPTALLIDDSRHFQSLISLLLRQNFPSLKVIVAENGFNGLVQAGQLQPDLLVVDFLLPGMDGAAFITALRSRELLPETRLIVASSLSGPALEKYRYALAGVPVVHKTRLTEVLPGLVGETLALARAAV